MNIKWLLCLALLITAAGVMSGLATGIATHHVPRLQTLDNHQDAVRLSAQQASATAVAESLHASVAKARASSRSIHYHTHLLNMALLALMCGLIMPLILHASARWRRIAAIVVPAGLVAGLALFPLGLGMLETWPLFGAATAAVGAAGATAAVGLLFILTRPL
jgi:hypothetical protein